MSVRLTFAFLLFSLTTRAVRAQTGDRPVVFRDVRVFDGQAFVEHQTVVIGGGKVLAVGDSRLSVPGNAEEVAGAGRTLLPGLIDAHVHVSQLWPIEALQQSLAFGVTTVLDMWTGPPPRGFTGKPALVRLKEIETSDSPDLAAVRTAGTGATARGGHPTQMEGGWAVLVTPSVNGPAEAAAFVASRIAEGSDFIKIIYDDANEAFGLKLPTLNEETIAALAAAAHANGRLAIAHIGTERQARGAISAGVDGLAHLFSGPTVSSEFVELAAKQHVFIIPTLSILYSTCGRPDGPGILREAETLKQVRAEFRIMLSIPKCRRETIL
jgi:imidazolonepropionase-like amidohydrolase